MSMKIPSEVIVFFRLAPFMTLTVTWYLILGWIWMSEKLTKTIPSLEILCVTKESFSKPLTSSPPGYVPTATSCSRMSLSRSEHAHLA